MDLYFNEIETFIMNKYIIEFPEAIQDKVIYLLQDGKRLRPILSLIFSCCENCIDSKRHIIYIITSSIEVIHCLSLVLDDLPEMDNDSFRRGKEAFHVKYGADFTNFFIYYMFNRIGLTLDAGFKKSRAQNTEEGFEEQDDNNNITKYNLDALRDIHHLFEYNLNMLIDGQYIDLEWSNYNSNNNSNRNSNSNRDFNIEKKLIIDLIDIEDFLIILSLDDNFSRVMNNIDLNLKKTSSLFNLSVCSGYLLQIWWREIEVGSGSNDSSNGGDSRCNGDIFNKLVVWSNILGYMFQISDDILDADEDISKDKPNICSIIGKSGSITLLLNGCKWLRNMALTIYDSMKGVEEGKENNKTSFNINAITEIIEKIEKRIGG
jgi:geranylgeranyl pyrophosphate synthase